MCVQPSVDQVVSVGVSGLPLHDIRLGRLVRQRYGRHLTHTHIIQYNTIYCIHQVLYSYTLRLLDLFACYRAAANATSNPVSLIAFAFALQKQLKTMTETN